MIYIASDHGGFTLKAKINEWLAQNKLPAEDLGPKEYLVDDDYPIYATALAKKVLTAPTNQGIIICRNGIGVCMVANKYKGIRAGLSWSPKHAVSGRNDDNTNVLVLPADYVTEQEAIEIVASWLKTPFSNEPRHIRRLSYDYSGN